MIDVLTTSPFHLVGLADDFARLRVLGRLVVGLTPSMVASQWLTPDLIQPSYPWLAHRTFLRLRLRFRAITPYIDLLASFLTDAIASRNLLPQGTVWGCSYASSIAGVRQRESGGRYICDCPGVHRVAFSRELQREHTSFGLPSIKILPSVLKYEARAYENANVISCLSTYAARTLVNEGVDATRIHIARWSPSSHFRPCGTPDPKRFVVLFIGHLSLAKGAPYLLEAFVKLPLPNKELWLAGTVDPVIRQLFPAAFAHNSVRLLGKVQYQNLPQLYSTVNVLALPSVCESFGMVIAEALACGCPVISSESNGGPDLLLEGEDGYLIPCRNSSAISEAIIQIHTKGEWDRDSIAANFRARRSREAYVRASQILATSTIQI